MTWVVANKVDIKGDAEWEKYAAEQEVLAAEAADVDAFGNKIVKKDIIKPFEDYQVRGEEVKKLQKGQEGARGVGDGLRDEMDVKYD